MERPGIRRQAGGGSSAVSARLEHAGEVLEGALGGGRVASWLEDAEVDEPGTAVELGVDGLDEVGLGGAVLVLGLHDDDTGDLLGALGRSPADDDGVARVPDVQLLEGNGSGRRVRSGSKA